MAPHTYISLFTGAGGLDLAVRLALPEARAVCYVENEVTAAEILAARIAEGSLDEAPIWSDVRTFPGRFFRGRVAGVVGGFPCPDYSVAGKRAGIVGKHGQLWNSFQRIIREVNPGWVFLENVPGILHPHKIRRWRCIGHNLFGRTIWEQYLIPSGLWFVLGDLAEMGFDAEWGCLPASAVGASHKRDRWFCLAYRPERGRESSRRGGFADRRRETLAIATEPRLEVGRREPGDGGIEFATAERIGGTLEHADRDGCEEIGRRAKVESAAGSGRDADVESTPLQSGSGLPLFAPGPSDHCWPDLLVRYPWMRPAISQAEAEYLVCGVAPGSTDELDFEDRADRLRSVGNLVCPMQGAAMLAELIRRSNEKTKR